MFPVAIARRACEKSGLLGMTKGITNGSLPLRCEKSQNDFSLPIGFSLLARSQFHRFCGSLFALTMFVSATRTLSQ
jgi:hypothetical protein